MSPADTDSVVCGNVLQIGLFQEIAKPLATRPHDVRLSNRDRTTASPLLKATAEHFLCGAQAMQSCEASAAGQTGHEGDAKNTSMESKRPWMFHRQARAGLAERRQGLRPR